MAADNPMNTVLLETTLDPPDEDGEIFDDDLDTLIKNGNILRANLDSEVEAAITRYRGSGVNNIVVLWRGCNFDVGQNMSRNSTASGIPQNSVPRLGSKLPKQEVQSQIGGDHGSMLPEFAAFDDKEEGKNVAKGFSWENCLAVVKINASYLTRGSETECGWVCDRTAPVNVCMIVDRRPLVLRETVMAQSKLEAAAQPLGSGEERAQTAGLGAGVPARAAASSAGAIRIETSPATNRDDGATASASHPVVTFSLAGADAAHSATHQQQAAAPVAEEKQKSKKP